MKKTFIKLITLLTLTALLLAGCGNNTAPTDAEASKESSVTSESVESATESTEETTTEKSTTEELTEPEIQATAVAEELELDDELSALVLEDFQIAWNDLEGDKEKFATYVDVMKEEFAQMAEAKANAPAESEEPKEEINWDIANLPDDRAWVDDLYNKLIADDYEAVLEILKDDSIAEKAEPYKYKSYVYDAYGYKLVTTDGKIVGLHLPKDITGTGDRAAFYAEVGGTDDGMLDVGYGDHMVLLTKDLNGNQTYEWFDGKIIHKEDGSTHEVEENGVYAIWEM